MKKFLLAVALSSAFVTGAIAQTYDPSPRDPPFGKANPDNDTFHLPNQTDLWGPVDTWGVSGGSVTNVETSRGALIRGMPATRTP